MLTTKPIALRGLHAAGPSGNSESHSASLSSPNKSKPMGMLCFQKRDLRLRSQRIPNESI